MPDPTRTTRVSHRRNGLQAACEPCRKAKVRCDISSTSETICSRCRKRKDPSRCLVLDAPMTQKSSIAKPAQVATVTSPVLSTPRSMTSSVQERFKETSGYLGQSSFTATIEPDDGPNEEAEITVEDDEESSTVDDTERVMMLQILESIPDEKTCGVLMRFYNEHTVGIGMSKLTLTFILEAFWKAFRGVMKRPRGKEEMERLAGVVQGNSQSVLEEPDGAREWHESFTGVKTRWESIGVMLVSFAYGFMSLSEAEYSKLPDNITKRGRKNLVAGMKKSTENCMHLTRNCLNLTALSLLHKNMLLETVIHGDFCLSVWRLHHDSVAVATALGLHAYQGSPTVTFKSEMRKRLSRSCFWNDKEIAMCTGRPPALSHRHYSCPLPSDVSDEALMEGGERLRDELALVDEEGWSTTGKMHDATICRIMASTAFIQDEVMEMFVGNAAQFSMERVRQLKFRTAETFGKNLPKMVHVTKEYIAAQPDKKMWSIMFARLDYLRIHFLLERLSVERANESKQSLLDVSCEIVDLVVFIWLSRDRSEGRHHDFDYIIMCYGMPSVGILCSELLKCIRQQPRTDGIRFPVSETVQNLSLLIGFLEWIKPAAGNYKLCQRMARVLKRVLEQVFDPKPEIVEQVEAAKTVERMQMLDANADANRDGSFWFPDGNDDLDWLNSIDWSKGMLMDLNWN